MRKILFLFVLMTGFSGNCQLSGKEILNNTVVALNALKTVEYESVKHTLSKKNETYKVEVSSFFDFTSTDTLIGAKYQFVFENGEIVFDGQKVFSYKKLDKKILYSDYPDKRSLMNDFTRFSYLELKKSLPLLFQNPNIEITILDNNLIGSNESLKLRLILKNHWIGIGGTLQKTEGYNSEYILTISSKDFLPIEFTYIYPQNKGYSTSEFKNIKLSIIKENKIWSYNRFPEANSIDTYENYYKTGKIESSKRMKVGQKAIDWSLPNVQDQKVSFSDLKGNLVLLEFWFSPCAPCIKAIPELNEIQKKYSEKGLSFYAIEYFKADKDILKNYIKKYNIKYPMLYNGEETAFNYGVWEAPTFFLIDKKGVVLYKHIGTPSPDLTEHIEKYLD